MLRDRLVTAGIHDNPGAGQRHDLTAVHNLPAASMTAEAAIASHATQVGVYTQ